MMERFAAVIGVFAIGVLALPHGVSAEEAPSTRFPAGATAFQANCVVCHGAHGQGQAGLAPPLTDYPARYLANAEGRRQLALTVLYGMYGDIAVAGQHYSFKMPSFAKLDDTTLAAVLNYVAFDVAQGGQTEPLTAADVGAERSTPVTGDEVRQHRAALLGSLGL